MVGSQALADESLLSLCHRRHVARLRMMNMFNSDSNHCLSSAVPSASSRALAAAHSLEFEV